MLPVYRTYREIKYFQGLVVNPPEYPNNRSIALQIPNVTGFDLAFSVKSLVNVDTGVSVGITLYNVQLDNGYMTILDDLLPASIDCGRYYIEFDFSSGKRFSEVFDYRPNELFPPNATASLNYINKDNYHLPFRFYDPAASERYHEGTGDDMPKLFWRNDTISPFTADYDIGSGFSIKWVNYHTGAEYIPSQYIDHQVVFDPVPQVYVPEQVLTTEIPCGTYYIVLANGLVSDLIKIIDPNYAPPIIGPPAPIDPECLLDFDGNTINDFDDECILTTF